MNLKAWKTIEKHHMMEQGGAVLAGVSGGADSVALLHLLCSLRGPLGIRVYAAHINHMIRGAEALRDEQYVEKICREWGVELFVIRADVRREAAESGESLEEAGRRIRYDYFEKKACELGSGIATAHTLSDSMETVLINLARGTGLKGLCGIPPVRGKIIRPLIECTRQEIVAYCHEHRLEYVVDSTNLSRDYVRNQLRLDVIPIFYRINPAFDREIARMTRQLGEDSDYLSSEAEKALKNASLGDSSYRAEPLLRLPEPIVSRALLLAVKEFSGIGPEALQVDRMLGILHAGRGKIQIKSRCFAEMQNGRLIFSDGGQDTERENFLFPLSEGTFDTPFYRLKIQAVLPEEVKKIKNFSKQYFKSAIDCDKIKGNVCIRPRKAGEKYRPVGRGVTKSLKKLFQESGIPAGLRDRIPVIADEEGVLWVPQFGPDERCGINKETRKIFVVEIQALEV